MDKREETYHMTDKEMARLVATERLIAGEITIKDAVTLPSLTIEFLLNVFFDQQIYYLGEDPECRTRVKAPFKRGIYGYATGR